MGIDVQAALSLNTFELLHSDRHVSDQIAQAITFGIHGLGLLGDYLELLLRRRGYGRLLFHYPGQPIYLVFSCSRHILPVLNLSFEFGSRLGYHLEGHLTHVILLPLTIDARQHSIKFRLGLLFLRLHRCLIFPHGFEGQPVLLFQLLPIQDFPRHCLLRHELLRRQCLDHTLFNRELPLQRVEVKLFLRQNSYMVIDKMLSILLEFLCFSAVSLHFFTYGTQLFLKIIIALMQRMTFSKKALVLVHHVVTLRFQVVNGRVCRHEFVRDMLHALFKALHARTVQLVSRRTAPTGLRLTTPHFLYEISDLPRSQ